MNTDSFKIIKFSITIPAFKKKYLQEAIKSVINQSYQNLELIIVNDASPENLDEVVKSLKDPRIKYYKNEKNCGAVDVVDNWNICLQYATGDYIICMGDDDKLLPNCLSEYNKLIKKHPGLGIYHGWTELIDEQSNVFALQAASPEIESVYSLIWHKWNGRNQYIGDFLFDTEFLKRNGGYYKLPLAWGSDDISAVIAAKCKGIANTQIPVFQYRCNNQTITNTGNIRTKVYAILQEKMWYEKFLDKKPKEHVDILYRLMIKNIFENHYQKKLGATIALELKNAGRFKLLFWMKNKKKFSLRKKALIYAFIQSFR